MPRIRDKVELTPYWLRLLLADWGDKRDCLDLSLFGEGWLVVGLTNGRGRSGYVGWLVSELSLAGVHSRAK